MRFFEPAIGVVAIVGAVAEAGEPVSPAADPAVQIRLLADATSIVPGAAFFLAVRFEIAAGWHVYWSNPGDAGLATTVRVQAPDGFEVGEVLYPGPTRFELPGDVVSFGYEGTTALFVRVVAPKAMSTGTTATFTASAKWLACKEACVSGEAEAMLNLAVGDSSKSANVELLEPHRRRLPRPSKDLADVDVAWTGAHESPSVTFSSASFDRLEFFPDRASYAALAGRSVAPASPPAEDSRVRATYRFTLDGRERPARLGGVLLANRKGEPTYIAVQFDWPK